MFRIRISTSGRQRSKSPPKARHQRSSTQEQHTQEVVYEQRAPYQHPPQVIYEQLNPYPHQPTAAATVINNKQQRSSSPYYQQHPPQLVISGPSHSPASLNPASYSPHGLSHTLSHGLSHPAQVLVSGSSVQQVQHEVLHQPSTSATGESIQHIKVNEMQVWCLVLFIV